MFFVNTDYSKEIQKAKIHLSKPNKTIISHIFEKQNTNLSVKLGNIYELTFSIPHFINGEHEIEKNPHTETIKEKMLLRVTLSGMTEWFIVDSIEEDGSDTDIFNVTAFSLGYELSHKRISSYIGEGKSCKAMATELLESSTWKVGTIDADIQYRSAVLTDENETKRTLEINGSNALDGILQVAEAFNAVPIWDTESKTISFKSLKNIGTFKGLTLNYGKLLSTINRSRTTDEMVTRMYAYGSEDLTIAGVNPTGQMYIEDFSFFMHPFERDANKNVVSHSNFMSDALCHAILDHKELIQTRSPQINSLMNDVLSSQAILQTLKTDLTELQLELQSIEYRLDTAKASESESLISRIESERVAKISEISAKEELLRELNSDLEAKENTIKSLRDSISSEAGFNTTLYDELNYYIIEKEWRDDRYINADELYEDALERFATLREPKVIVTVDIDNLFEVMDEQYYWDKLELGDLIKIKYPQMDIEYMAQIIEINYDFEGGSISIVIANTEKTGNEMDRLKELLSKSQSASTLLDNNKYKWDKVVGVEDEVYRLINSEWDANKRKILAGVNNQIEIGNRGIIIRNPDNPDDVVIMQSGIIALSKDGGDTWKTAIKPDGIVAERIIGNLIAGRNLVITNGNGTFTVDEDGVRIVGTSLQILGGLPASELDQDYVNDVNLQIREAKEATEQLESDIDSMFSDSVITQLESITLKLSLKRLMSESLDVLSIASELGIVDERSNYSTAINNLESHLKSKYIDKASSVYPIVVSQADRNLIENHFTAVENTKSVLTNRIMEERESNAKSYANELRNSINVDIDEVRDALDNIDAYIGESFKDGIIEEAEAKAIEKYVNTLNNEKADIDSKYNFVYTNASLVDTTIKSSLLSSKTAYNTAHTNLITSITNAIRDKKTDSTEKSDVDSKFSLYRTALGNLSTALEKAVNAISIEQSKVAENNAKAYAEQMRASINNELNDIKGVLDDLDMYVGDSFRDGIIEEAEAKAIEKYINTLNTEKADIDSKYNSVYANTSLTNITIKSSLLNSKNAYNTAHTNLINSINTAISDRKTTATEKLDVDSKFTLYKNALSTLSTNLEKAVDAIAIEKAKVAESNANLYTDQMKHSIESELDDIRDSLDELDVYIGDSFKDGVIEEAEAKAIEKYINILNAEKADIDSKYNSIYANTSLVNANTKSSLLNSKNSYNTAHTNLITSINNAISDKKTTATEKADVDSRFNLYRNALGNLSTNLDKAVDAIAIEKARVAEANAKTYADQIRTSVNNELDDIRDALDNIDVFIGDSFKDGIIEEAEAKAIGAYLNSLSTEKADIDNRYTFVYSNASLVNATVKSSLLSSKTAYNTAHTNLLSSINNAISDRKTTATEKADVDNKFALYKTALSNLSTAFERAIDAIAIEKARVAEQNAKDNSVGKGEVLNGVKIDAQNGLVVTTSDSKTRVTLNASKGFNIQKNTGTTSAPNYSDVFHIDNNGNVQLKSGVISWGDVNSPTATDIGALPSNSSMLTKITSTGVYTGSITTNQLTVGTTKISTAMIENLVVGTNVTMGANASISWNNITSKPTIPTTASQVGAISSTYIDSTGVWTGKINANTITSGTLSADRIDGGTISGVNITGVTISGANITGGNIRIDTDAFVGNKINVGANVYNPNGTVAGISDEIKSIVLRSGRFGSATIAFNPQYEEMSLRCFNAIELDSQFLRLQTNYIDFSNVMGITWGNNRPTAVFG